MSYLIKDTTREEREQIVASCLSELDDACEGCTPRIADMYQAYIEGKMELREVNMAFQRGYVSGQAGPEHSSCVMEL